jgi:hypothetical protein
MSNFTFLPASFRAMADAAQKAEGHILGDPRAACFHARFVIDHGGNACFTEVTEDDHEHA